jgi:ribosomal protein L24
VLAGKDKGKQGVIGILDRKRHRVFVQGLNTVSFLSAEII